MDQTGLYVLLRDVALLLGVVLLLLPVLLFQQLGQRLQGLGAPQRGPLGIAGVVLNEVNAFALHLHLEEEREAAGAISAHTHRQLPLSPQETKQGGTHTSYRIAPTTGRAYPQPIPSQELQRQAGAVAMF